MPGTVFGGIFLDLDLDCPKDVGKPGKLVASLCQILPGFTLASAEESSVASSQDY